jgi:hypothetical protein
VATPIWLLLLQVAKLSLLLLLLLLLHLSYFSSAALAIGAIVML